jgi:hypothetical protein
MIACSISAGSTKADGKVEASQGQNHHVLSKQPRDANMAALRKGFVRTERFTVPDRQSEIAGVSERKSRAHWAHIDS